MNILQQHSFHACKLKAKVLYFKLNAKLINLETEIHIVLFFRLNLTKKEKKERKNETKKEIVWNTMLAFTKFITLT